MKMRFECEGWFMCELNNDEWAELKRLLEEIDENGIREFVRVEDDEIEVMWTREGYLTFNTLMVYDHTYNNLQVDGIILNDLDDPEMWEGDDFIQEVVNRLRG